MPIYEYACQSCESKFEHLQRSMSSDEKIVCPDCGSKKTKRALSVFAVAADTAKSSGGSEAPSCWPVRRRAGILRDVTFSRC